MGAPLVRLNPETLKVGSIESPIDQQKRLLSLRKALDEQRMGQQAIEMNDLKLQEAQREQAEQQAADRAWQQSGADVDKYFRIAPAMGVSLDTIAKQRTALEEYQTKALQRTDAEHKQITETNNAVYNTLRGIESLPEEARAAAWGPAVSKLVQDKWLTAEQAQQYMQYPGADGLQQLTSQVQIAKQLEDRNTAARAAMAEKRLEAQQAEIVRHNKEMERLAAQRKAGQLDDLLTPAQATQLGVPYGTTKKQAFGAQGTTAATRTMTEAAPKVKQFTTKISKMITDADKGLGPMASRWRDFKQGKIGIADPQFAALRTDVALLTTLLMRMHVGARGGEQMREHFEELLQLGKQSPENLQAAIQEIADYADAVQYHGGPEKPSSAIEDEIEVERGPDGKLRVKGK